MNGANKKYRNSDFPIVQQNNNMFVPANKLILFL